MTVHSAGRYILTAGLRAGLVTLLFLLAGLAPVSAQVPGYGPTLLDLVPNVRAISLGHTYSLASTEAQLLFANPARLTDISGVQGSLGSWGGDATLASVAGGGEWLGGGLAFGLRVMEAGEQSSIGTQADGESHWAGTLGYAREVFGFDLGVSGHVFRSRVGAVASTGGAFDLGVAKEVFDITFGLSATNFGPDLQMNGEKIPLPYRVTLGAGTDRAWVGPLDVGGAAAVSYRPDGEWIPSAGVEVAWWPVRGRTFVARGGLRRVPTGSAQPWTLGAGFEGDRVELSYAYQGDDGYEAAHHIGIRWR